MKIEMESTPQKSTRPLERTMAKFANMITLLGSLLSRDNLASGFSGSELQLFVCCRVSAALAV